MNVRLSHALYMGFSIIIITTLILAFIVWSLVNKSATISQEIESDDVPGVLAYFNVLDAIGSLQTNALEYLNGDAGQRNAFEANANEFQQQYLRLRALESAKASDVEKMDRIISLANQYIERVNQGIFTKFNPADEQQAIDKINQLTKNIGAPLEDLLDQLAEKRFTEAYKSTALDRTLNQDLPSIRYYLELVDEAGDMIATLNAYIMGDPAARDTFNNDAGAFAGYLDKLRPLEPDPQASSQIDEVEQYYYDIIRIAQEVFEGYDPSGKRSANMLVGELKQSIILPLEEILNNSATEETNDSIQALAELNNNMSTIIFWLTINVIVVLVVGIAVAWGLLNIIRQRLDVIAAKAKSIADGDLSEPPINETNKDELGELARAIDAMQQSLRSVLSNITSVASEVASNTQMVEDTTKLVASGIEEQADKATLIASAVEEMTVTVNQVADQSTDAAASSRQAGEEATNGGKLMQETVNGMNRISEVVNETAETVDSLGKRGEEIGNVIKVINDIAEQTNLLALNAAIEAARAGELGRGFAVVADEVRSLAERTSKATEEVGGLISSIQNETRQAVERMSEGTHLVAEGVTLSNSAGDALTQIVSRAQDVNQMIDMIATAGNEQATAAQEMSRDINTISQIADNSVRTTQDGAQAVSQLYRKVEELEQVVARFKL
ncbi:methyl-accepting chemotaxis protein [Vibrio coralliilyticus]|uniref:methyl-accepting chemotaxis protein n=1 Tax=Vibrio coralliilyticus TaxID=190893 RepID=UPI000512876A|nr:methyl-accepting chemotaxis protein [Vibrio coralliilyticus]AIU67229.1 chemotaxis protein [Vibrio coralliilyticus]MCC2522361.1 methyl-accepting chemotaxis protein [Vibrio coralliilyticus]NOI57630.1 methyl-accepting chemotaxis protein [Vibrio coralliilyticus]NOI75188.1 methyl-accepting chemotaxis protein [Vibrio coralliilyticus]NRF28523.1 methyl-accepting chemotaxis protein [Vibrio coralliilyticus]